MMRKRIFNASRYLSDLTNRKITKENLKKIERAEFSFSTRKGTILIRVLLPIEREEVPAAIAIQNAHYRSPVMAYAR